MAILLVLGGHFFHWPAARTGVEVFFVLSGLLMSQILFERATPIQTFYRRRIARIFPTFYLYIGAIALVSLVALPVFQGQQLLWNCVFLHSYMPASVPTPFLLPLQHLWSLNVEEHSYVFLSLIALVAGKSERLVIALLTLAVLGSCATYAYYDHIHFDGIFRTECAALPLLGSAAMNLAFKGLRWKRTLLVSAAIVFVGCIVVSRHLHGSQPLDYVIKPLSLAVMVNTLSAAPTLIQRALSAAWLRWFGICSFSIYLWQQPFTEWSDSGHIRPVVALAAALIVGALSFYRFEGPMRKLIRNPRRSAAPRMTDGHAIE